MKLGNIDPECRVMNHLLRVHSSSQLSSRKISEFPIFAYLNIELRHGEKLSCADSCERGHGGRSCRVLSCGTAHEQLGLEQALQLLREVGEAHLPAGILQARVQALHRF